MLLDLSLSSISIFSCVLPFFITLENKSTNPLPPVTKREKLVISPVGAPIAPTNDETATLSIGTVTKELNLYKKTQGQLRTYYFSNFFFYCVFLQ